MAHRGTNPDPDLLTIREVAAVLRMKPDTIYRWARRGRLGAVKLGKEWRIPASELEAMIGRPLGRAARPRPPATAPAAAKAVASPPGAEALERRLQAFVVPRDHILAVAADEASLEALQAAFWQLAALSGARLVVIAGRARTGSVEALLAREALSDVAAVAAVSDDASAREAVMSEATPGEPVWADYGRLDQLAGTPAAIEAHARLAAAAALTSDVTSLAALVAPDWEALDFDARLRIQSHHRALAQVSRSGAVLSRVR